MRKHPGPPHDDGEAQLDRLLDGALASYTPAVARPGLEDRLKARLAAAALPRRRPLVWLSWAAAAAAALTALLAIPVLHLHRPALERSKLESSAPAAHSPASANAAAPPATLPQRERGAAARTGAPARRARLADGVDAVSLREMRAPSHPAPPAPLTRQERLLLEVVHHGDPGQQALLNPEIRAQEEAREEAEFHAFVERSIDGDRN